MKNKLITISEAIEWINKISTCEYLSENPTSSMFMIFKDRYENKKRYFAYFMPSENYTEDDMYMHKIFNNVKEEEFMFICVINEAFDDTNAIFYTNQDFINMVEIDESFSFDDYKVDKVFEDYYTNKGMKFYGIYQNEPYDYINSIDKHNVICNPYDAPELININDEMISCFIHFTDNKRCFRFSDFEYMFVSKDDNTNDIGYFIDTVNNILEMKKYRYINEKEIMFVYVYDFINNSNSYCTDPKFIEYCNAKGKKYMQTHYNIDIVKDYFKETKNIVL